MPYQSGGGRRNNVQVGVGRSLWGGTPPPPIPERVLDGIPGCAAWVALLFCIASAVAFPRVLLLIAALLGFYSAFRFLLAGIANYMGLNKIKKWEATNWHEYYLTEAHPLALPWEAVHHVVVIPNYKEPLPILRRTLDALKIQVVAKEQMTIVLAMESADETCEEKAYQLISEYQHDFKNLYFTIHPRGLPGEMQCKSANESWAMRWVKRQLVDELHYDIDKICVTTMDADTRWHPHYFASLTALFALDSQRHFRFWQSPIRYHGNIWSINPLLRIVNAYATAMELAYLAAPWWRALPMSSYSLSLRLLDSSGYWDGDVIADEWHMFIKAYFAHSGNIDLIPIMLPFLADATIGNGIFSELRERYQQTLRHAWGSKEVGYMIAKMLDHPEVDFGRSFSLLVRISHDILLAGAGWIILTIGSQLPVLLNPSLAPLDIALLFTDYESALANAIVNITQEPVWILLIISGGLVVVLGIVFWFQDLIVRPPRTSPQTWRERLWAAVSFPLLPVLVLIVLAIPTIQAQTRLLLGEPLQFRVTRKL